MLYLGKYKLLKNYIYAVDIDYVLNIIIKAINKNQEVLLAPVPSHILVTAFFDNNFNNILNSYDYLLPDSVWIKNALNFLYGSKLPKNIRGTDLMLEICKLSQKFNFKIYMYGTNKNTLYKLEKKLLEKFPQLKIVGKEESKYQNLTLMEKKTLIKNITLCKPNIIFIGLSSPMQQEFAYGLCKVEPKLTIKSIVIPVGAAFDFISGTKKEAPVWLQKAGFEWFFRIISEPRRLWKRYIIEGTLFIILSLFQKILMTMGRNIKIL
ncbi:MAG: WecB/TagA/CpsF family glycosyl transferase [Candidatus Gottesmanbacteria bacterium GW2011_GWA2_43_14]|uniref:WecB/TagA/CpsF family glycosyl transferase n=1 Tax=Candidatus Gottesmanbacteria bacterium GW2011_GWA2_43_14 TaxID=1618443 RepID=A0A0G1DLI6_9BACT|nr:MAG: WecB/TagA/CpsF family glycosyl transferase [Candidatus Gottesmanbacteria bacterium GW2011_GWA2_43_14]